MIKITALSLAAALGFGLAPMQSASAATLSYEQTANGTTGGGAVTAYTALPASDFFGNTLGAASSASANTFDDYFVFTVSDSTVDAATFTLNAGSALSLSDLQMRVYSAAGTSAQAVESGPAAGGIASAWSAPVSANGATSQLTTTDLTGGTYVLQVQGDVTGKSGGSYAGIIDLQPVPVPAALPLLLSGLGLLGGMLCKRCGLARG